MFLLQQWIHSFYVQDFMSDSTLQQRLTSFLQGPAKDTEFVDWSNSMLCVIENLRSKALKEKEKDKDGKDASKDSAEDDSTDDGTPRLKRKGSKFMDVRTARCC